MIPNLGYPSSPFQQPPFLGMACPNLSKATRDSLNEEGRKHQQHYLNASFHTSLTLDEPSVISATKLLVKAPAQIKGYYDVTPVHY